jgi:hypothetical protein
MITAEDGNNNVQGTHCIDPAGADYFFPQDLLHEQANWSNNLATDEKSSKQVNKLSIMEIKGS